MARDDDPRRALERLRYRHELRSAGEDELSDLIESEALKRTKPPGSIPAHAKGLVAVLNTLPSWGRVVILLALIALLATGAGSKLLGLW